MGTPWTGTSWLVAGQAILTLGTILLLQGCGAGSGGTAGTAGVAVGNPTTPATTGTSDTRLVRDWNVLAVRLVNESNMSGQMGTRNVAMMHTAMFDAINNASGRPYRSHRVTLGASLGTSGEAAGIAAAQRVLAALFPGRTADIDALYQAHLATLGSDLVVESSLSLGRLVADDILAWRAEDNAARAGGVAFSDGTQPGQWRRTDANPPVLPGWGLVSPFALPSPQHFRTAGPPALTSAEYTLAYDETKSLGGKNSATRTMQQSMTAMFWMMGIPEIWNTVARDVASQRQLPLLEEARLFALLNVAQADALIATWDMKYGYALWRPVTAVREGEQDGNADTAGDPAWEPLLVTPAFPEYVSAHSTVSSASARVLSRFIHADDFTFTVTSKAPGMPPRTYSSFTAAVRECGISRIYGGIHFAFGNVHGQATGQQIGDYVFDNCMNTATGSR